MKDFKTTPEGRGTTSTTVKIQFIRTMLRRESRREFNNLARKVGITTNGNIKLIEESLLG